MEKNADSVLQPTIERQRALLEFLPTIKQVATVDSHYLFQLDSSDIQPEHWQVLAETIIQHYNDYDGFVILHGSDTMAYTATALSFMLEQLGKPVILTDTLVPLTTVAPDNHSNIVNAVRFACSNIAEVAIVFGKLLLRGNRSKKIYDLGTQSFTSPNYSPLGKVDIKLSFSKHCQPRHHQSPQLKAHLVKEVVLITLFPGITNEHILGMVPPRTKGVVIAGYGAGNIPLGLGGIEEAITTIINHDITVVISTQCLYSGVSDSRYVGGAFIKKLGALSAQDMTTEAALIKLMWVLAQTSQASEIHRLYETNLRGELTNTDEVYGV